jgi:riboflavin kinase/FMN adenylyltransferase
MNIVHSLQELTRDSHSVVTVGAFDGVHRAHQEIVREVVNRSKMKEGRSVIVTFDPHPKEVVASRKGPVRLLSTLEEKIDLLAAVHVDILLVIEFTYEFSRLSPREFYQSYVVDRIGASEVVVGYDHMFGRDREAGIAELVQLGKEFNFSVFAVHPYTVAGEAVSSTQIRNALGAGDIDRAKDLLGYSYGITGTVVAGDGRGKTIGFPTANIRPLSEKKIIPGRGVYFVSVERGDRPYFGMLNLGIRPTVTDGTRETMEVHVFDLSEDIYGESVRIRFLKKLRDERKFDSVQELIHQLDRDKEQSLTYVAEYVKRK